MFIITHIHSGNKLYLTSEVKKYTVGRLGSDFVLANDSSISRLHAVFHITDKTLMLEDLGSKYGTYFNDQIETKTRLPKDKRTKLNEGDRILFGALKNEWLVSKNHISTMTSSLSEPQINEIKIILNSLGGNIISKWEPRCTHLTMSELTITIKVLHALIEKIPIVSCEYWKEYLKVLRETKSPPNTSLYLPERSTLLSSAINVESFKPNEKRKTLFRGKTFVFMSKKHNDLFSPIVLKAGGKCKTLNSNVDKSYLLQENVVVVQYVSSTQSQGSQTINIISEYLEANSRRPVPEYEIGLAIVCCTVEKYCNPSYVTISHILPSSSSISPNIGTILAENTRPQKSQINSIELSIVEIPDTDSDGLTGISTPRNPVQSEIYEDCQSNMISNSEQLEAIERVSEVPQSNFPSEGKRKRVSPGEIEKNAHISKKINISSQDTLSAQLAHSSDMISHVHDSGNCTENVYDVNKRKRKSTDSGGGLETLKKLHTSKAVCEDLAITNRTPEVIPLTKSTENQKNCSNSVAAAPQISDKNYVQSKNTYSGFLQKSQINKSQREVQNKSKNSLDGHGPYKRGRIARISDNDSDNEDDLFNFGLSPKKTKTLGDNSDDELFNFGKKACDMADGVDPENLSETQPFVPNKEIISKFTKLNIKVEPLKVTPEGWISKKNSFRIKCETTENVKKENEIDDIKERELIDSIKGGFEERVRKMNLFSKRGSCSTVQDSTLNSNRKNFKAFVKIHNYKPQTVTIRTIPKVVAPIH